MSTVSPGDVVCVTSAVTSGLKVTGKNGTSTSPITIQAATPLGTTLPSFEINTSTYIVVRDFKFKTTSTSTLFKVANGSNSKILRNEFDFTGAAAQSGIVTTSNGGVATSDNVEIAYNYFHDHDFPNNDGQTLQSGSFIKTQVDTVSNANAVSKNMWVHHNYFKNMAPHLTGTATTPDGDSDREAIAFGTSASQQLVTNHIVEYNLFEDCDGENEIVTVKTSANVIRYNTFKNSMGSLSIRFGHDTEAYGNYFYGEGASTLVTDPNYQTGGIRIYGKGHKVYNNYMQNLTGTTWRQPILIDNGDSTYSSTSTSDKHWQINDVEVSFNTIVNSAGGISVGSDGTFNASYTKKPLTSKIANNVVVGSSGVLFYDNSDASNSFEGNIVYATGSATAVGGTAKTSGQVSIANPLLVDVTKNGLSVKTLSSTSPAINAAAGTYAYVTKDIDGETRSTPDTGADEYSASPVLTIKPLKATDVGPSAP